jgi:hypothetical protein
MSSGTFKSLPAPRMASGEPGMPTGHRVEAADDLIPPLEAAFQARGVHLVAVPIDYSENMRVLVQELKASLPAIEPT